MLSPHQLPYIKAIAASPVSSNVVIVCPLTNDPYRKSMGWVSLEESNNEDLKIVVNPSKKEINEIFNEFIDAHHFFSGLRATPMVFLAFKISLKHNLKRYLIVEGPYLYKHPKWMHYIKTWVLEKKYFKHIDKVFAIGHHAMNWYPLFGFSKKHVIPFVYVVDKPEISLMPKFESKLRLIFIGNLIHRKGIDILISTLAKVNYLNLSLDIVGDGTERDRLKNLSKTLNLSKKVHFRGVIENNTIRNELTKYDVLVLPSRHDGWGAVINEALMSGLFVICSNKCGARELINHKENGIVYTTDSELIEALNYSIEELLTIRENRFNNNVRAICIDGESIGNYVISILNEELVYPPWKQDQK